MHLQYSRYVTSTLDDEVMMSWHSDTTLRVGIKSIGIVVKLTTMNSAIKVSIWVVVALLVGGQLNDLLQSTMVDAGFLQKRITITDAW